MLWKTSHNMIWRAPHKGKLGTTERLAPWRAWHHGVCHTMESAAGAPRTQGPAATALTPHSHPWPLAVPLRDAEGARWPKEHGFGPSHAPQLQPGSDLFALKFIRGKSTFQAQRIPLPLLSSSPARAARAPSPAKTARPHPSRGVTPCPRTQPRHSPSLLSKRKLPLAPSAPRPTDEKAIH